MRTKTIVVAAVLAVLVTGGVTVAYAALSNRAAESAPARTPTVASSERGAEHDHELVPAPTATADLEEVTAVAREALDAYASRDLSYSEWFAQLEPYLHETSVDAYATVDPANIPEIVVDGNPVPAENSSDTYAVVYVPTSAGQYTVELRRADPASSWGVTRFQPES